MEAGLLYDPDHEEFGSVQIELMDKLHEFNALKPSQRAEIKRYMKEIFAECGENVYIQRPLYANWGGSHVHIGSNVYANYDLTLVDDGHIYIGDWVQFGPNVTVVTASHPVLPELRKEPFLQFNKDVHIEEGAWIGAGAVILPGVTIGKWSVIGAGSVVTKDIPAGVVAYGNPCRVAREINKRDRYYFYKNERIDWDELTGRD